MADRPVQHLSLENPAIFRSSRIYRISRIFLLIIATQLILNPGNPVSAQTSENSSVSSEREHTLVLGRISDEPKKHFARLEVMADYLAQRLGDVGISSGRVVFAKDVNHMAQLLENGQVDIFSETPFSAIRLVDIAGAEVLAREWKKGVATYKTVFFKRKESDLMSLMDLKGKKIAFEDPGSTSAFFIPLALIRLAGLETVKLVNVRDEVAPDKVGYAFTRGERNMVKWVSLGVTDAGTFSNIDWEEITHKSAEAIGTLEVFHESAPFLRSIILARSDLQSKIKTSLKDILFSMHVNPEGKKVLKTYNKVKKYDAIGPEATASIDEVRRLMPILIEKLIP